MKTKPTVINSMTDVIQAFGDPVSLKHLEVMIDSVAKAGMSPNMILTTVAGAPLPLQAAGRRIYDCSNILQDDLAFFITTSPPPHPSDETIDISISTIARYRTYTHIRYLLGTILAGQYMVLNFTPPIPVKDYGEDGLYTSSEDYFTGVFLNQTTNNYGYFQGRKLSSKQLALLRSNALATDLSSLDHPDLSSILMAILTGQYTLSPIPVRNVKSEDVS